MDHQPEQSPLDPANHPAEHRLGRCYLSLLQGPTKEFMCHQSSCRPRSSFQSTVFHKSAGESDEDGRFPTSATCKCNPAGAGGSCQRPRARPTSKRTRFCESNQGLRSVPATTHKCDPTGAGCWSPRSVPPVSLAQKPEKQSHRVPRSILATTASQRL